MPSVSRNRGIRVDVSSGQVLANVNYTAAIAAANVIAKSALKSKRLTSPTTANTVIAKNIGPAAAGLVLSPSGGSLAQIVCSLFRVGRGTPTVVEVRRGTTYDTSTLVSTITIPLASFSITTSVSIAYSTGEAFFVDITAQGTTPAKGLAVQFNYYG